MRELPSTENFDLTQGRRLAKRSAVSEYATTSWLKSKCGPDASALPLFCRARISAELRGFRVLALVGFGGLWAALERRTDRVRQRM